MAFDLAMEIFEESKKFPVEDKYSLTDQMRILQRGPLLHQLLGFLGIVPEIGIFRELVQLRKARRGCIDVKDASSAARLTA